MIVCPRWLRRGRLLIAALAAAVLGAAAPAQAQLAGDLRSTPIVISTNPFSETRSTTSYTSSADDPTHLCTGSRDSRTVWYRFTPNVSGTATISTAGSNYDTVLSVYVASTLQEIACNDDFSGLGLQSRVQVALTANTQYLIEVSAFGANGAGGSLTFSLTFEPQGDLRSAPIVISTTAFSETRTTTMYTSSADDPTHPCTGSRDTRTVWYRFTPSVSGTATISTAGSNYDTVLSVYVASTLQEIACNDDFSGLGLQSRVQVALTANTQYLIEVSAFGANGVGGSLTFSLQFAANQVVSVTKAGTGIGTVTSSPSGINCGATCTAAFASGTAVTLTATPVTGSVFAGWSGGGCSGTGSCVVTLSAPTTVTATFNASAAVPATLTVQRSGTGSGTVTSSPSGINCGATCAGTFASGTVVTLTATAATGSVFAGWSGGGCSGTGSCVVTLSAPTTVTATFSAASVPVTLTLTVQRSGTGSGTVTSSPGGINCGTTCTASFASGTSVTLSASAASGSTFAGWSGGGCSGTGTCTVTLTSATTVTALFDTPSTGPVTLTVALGGFGRGNVTTDAGMNCRMMDFAPGTPPVCNETLTRGTIATLQAAPEAGNTFRAWVGGACDASTANECTVTLTDSVQVTADFNPPDLPETSVLSSVLPVSRSMRVGVPATVFVTILNGGTITATGCGVSLGTNVPARFRYQMTDSRTNTPIGLRPSMPATIPPGGGQSYVITITPTAAFPPTEVALHFRCRNSGLAPITVGLNTLLLSASTTAVPDLIALVGIPPSSDGAVAIPGNAAFATATVNVGAEGTLTATVDTGGRALPVQGTLCETNPFTGGCLGPTGPAVTRTVRAGETPTFSVFLTALGTIDFAPDRNRVFVRFRDAAGNVRGATSVAVRTVAPPPASLTIQRVGDGSGTVTGSPGGINCGTVCSATVASGTMVTLAATAAPASVFAGWSGGGCAGTGACVVTVTAATTVSATFNMAPVGQFPLTIQRIGNGSGTVTGSAGGINCGTACSATVASGTAVSLTATAAPGSVFAGWTGGGCAGTGSCMVTVTAATAVTATFNTATPTQVLLTVERAGNGIGTVTSNVGGIDCGTTCSVMLPGGSSVVLTALREPGSRFVGWSGGGCSGSGACLVRLNVATTVTAVFEPEIETPAP
jgi:hypothetical protein